MISGRFTKPLLYTLYFAALCVFFLYVLFPAQSVKGYIQRQVQEANPAYRLTIARLQPALPWHLSMSDIALYLHGRKLFAAPQGTLSPRLLSLLGPQQRFDFEAAAMGGHIRVYVKHPPPQLAAEIHLEKIELQQIPALKAFGGRSAAGVLSSAFQYRRDKGFSRAAGSFSLSDVRIALVNPFMGLKNVLLRSMSGKFTLRQDNLRFSQCTFSGRQADGSLAGRILLRQPPGDSRLNMETVIRPQAELLAALKNSPTTRWLAAKTAPHAKFTLKLGGTIAKPSLNLR